MATLTIRNLPDVVRDQLRKRAGNRGVSMEAEARTILAQAVTGRDEHGKPDRATEIQEWIAAQRQPVRGEKSATDALIRDRRRDVIIEVIREGRDPEKEFGANYDRILAEAKWSRRQVIKLAAKIK